MKYTEFIFKLKDIPLSYQTYQQRGLKDSFIEEYIRGYHPVKRTNAPLLLGDEDELIKLCTVYDLSDTVIGMIEFLPMLVEAENDIYFGKVELDMLGVHLPSGEIKCYENDTEFILYDCARNGELFLSAIIEAGIFLEKRAVDDKLYDDVLLAEDVAQVCSELAGGSRYKNFYHVLLS